MPYSKVVLIILDGLRPDAITAGVMPNLLHLAQRHWQAGHAVTVEPSITVAALTSIATGVTPATRGLIEPSFRSIGMFSGLTLLPVHLRKHHRQVTIVASDVPAPTLIVARTLLGVVGAGTLISGGTRPVEVAEAAIEVFRQRGPGLTVVYLNDCDRAGHAEGWMSPWYLSEAGRLDDAIGLLAPLSSEPETLVIVTADHGGGGVALRDHGELHPLNECIPLILASTALAGAGVSGQVAKLIDIPATIVAAFDLPVPRSFEGRVLTEALGGTAEAVA